MFEIFIFCDFDSFFRTFSKVQKTLADKEAELAKIKEERDTLSDQKSRIVQNAGKKIKKLQAELADANAKLGNDAPKKEPVSKTPVPGK